MDDWVPGVLVCTHVVVAALFNLVRGVYVTPPAFPAQEEEQAHVREVLLARTREEQQGREPARPPPHAGRSPQVGGDRGGGGRSGSSRGSHPVGSRGGRGRGRQGIGRGTGENCRMM